MTWPAGGHAVYQTPGRQTGEGIDPGKRQARNHPDGGVADAKLGFDRFDHHRKNLPADKVIGKHQGQQHQQAMTAPAKRGGWQYTCASSHRGAHKSGKPGSLTTIKRLSKTFRACASAAPSVLDRSSSTALASAS